MEKISSDFCKNCGSVKFKKYEDLTEEDKIVVERIAGGGKFSIEQIKQQRFCCRCLYPLANAVEIV